MASLAAKEDKYRDFMYGEGEKDTVWRFGAPPDYSVVNKLFEVGQTQEWPEGSLEEEVQRLVKTFEMELVHKVQPQDFKSINPDKFPLIVNAGGSYNAFLQTQLPKKLRIYDTEEETDELSNREFTTTFPWGFAVEILQVYAGPPTITYKFRHWGYMEGPLKGHPPNGDLVEFVGTGIFHMDDRMRVEKVEFFYERGNFLCSGFLKAKGDAAAAVAAAGGGCPVLHK